MTFYHFAGGCHTWKAYVLTYTCMCMMYFHVEFQKVYKQQQNSQVYFLAEKEKVFKECKGGYIYHTHSTLSRSAYKSGTFRA